MKNLLQNEFQHYSRVKILILPDQTRVINIEITRSYDFSNSFPLTLPHKSKNEFNLGQLKSNVVQNRSIIIQEKDLNIDNAYKFLITCNKINLVQPFRISFINKFDLGHYNKLCNLYEDNQHLINFVKLNQLPHFGCIPPLLYNFSLGSFSLKKNEISILSNYYLDNISFFRKVYPAKTFQTTLLGQRIMSYKQLANQPQYQEKIDLKERENLLRDFLICMHVKEMIKICHLNNVMIPSVILMAISNSDYPYNIANKFNFDPAVTFPKNILTGEKELEDQDINAVRLVIEAKFKDQFIKKDSDIQWDTSFQSFSTTLPIYTDINLD